MTWQNERECGIFEKWARRFVTSILYFRGYRKFYPNDPFYTPGAIKRISSLLDPKMTVFEWGSGISSLWYAKQVKKYICVEHSSEWFNRIKEDFKNNNVNNVEIIFSAEIDLVSDYLWKEQWQYYSILNHPPANPKFKDYIATIDQYPDKHFDCIVIDGRERIGCLVHAISKLSDNGFLIFDDSHRPRYQEAFRILHNWKHEKYNFGLGQTTIFYNKQ